MFTSADKALVALVMAVLYIVNSVWGVELFDHVTEEMVSAIIAALTPILVWVVPNRK